MKKFNFLVCYDISCPKRLSKISKCLERVSIRIQKSIFFYPDVEFKSIKELIEKLNTLIKNDEDDIRIYKIDINKSFSFHSAIDLKNPNILS
jgi:CRISPR-associated protein Cas2